MRANLELRVTAGRPELRSAENGVRQIVGYAAVFNREAVIAGNFRERVLPGAFREAIAADDVRGLFNHNPSQIIGRSKAGTLRAYEDEVGLRYEIDLNADDPEAMSIAAKVQRGDVSGSSFRFVVSRDGYQIVAAERAGDLPLRSISRVTELIDVGPVTFPAYDETTTEARDMAAALTTKPEETPAAPAVADAARAAMTSAEGEEAAELVQYQTAAAALATATAALAKATEIANGLIAAETTEPTETEEAEAAEEEVETAQLRALLVLCSQICGAVGGVSALAQAMLSDEYDPILYARSSAVADADRVRSLRLEAARASL